MLKLHPSWFVFFSLVITGASLVLSADNWFMMWIGFELSLLGFLPMFSGSHLVTEGMVKYFLIQAGGSALFLLSFLWDMELAGTLCLLSMLLKMGAFPFHQWVPTVMTSLSWPGCLLLITVQKIAPLGVVLTLNSTVPNLTLLSGMLSILTSSLLGFNQTYLRALMGYSSIAHSGWLLCASIWSLKLTVLYFIVYCYISAVLFLTFHSLNSLKVTSGSPSPSAWGLISLLLLTLAGIPPFSVFFLKVTIISLMSSMTLFIVPILIGAMLSIYYYLNFIIPSTLTYWDNSQHVNPFLLTNGLLGSLVYPLTVIL